MTVISTTVGRETELALLRQSLDVAGSVVLLSGAAGIGKSHLIRLLITETSGSLVLTTEAAAGLSGPHELIARALRRHILNLDPPSRLALYTGGAAAAAALLPPDSLPSTPPAPHDAAALCAAVIQLLANIAAQRPSILVLEDLHWADPDSLEMVTEIFREASAIPLTVLATLRSEDLDGTALESLYLDVWKRLPHFREILLAPLAAAEQAELVALLLPGYPADAVAHVLATSDGRPFVIQELCAAIRSGVTAGLPRSVQSLVLRRLKTCSRELRDFLRHAALLGVDFPLEPIASALEIPPDGLGRLLAEGRDAELLVRSGPPAFRHALTHQAVLSELRAVDRHAAVQRLVDALAPRLRASGIPPVDMPPGHLSRVAALVAETGDHDTAYRLHLAALMAAVEVAATVTAAREASLACSQAQAPELRMVALGRLCEHVFLTHHPADAPSGLRVDTNDVFALEARLVEEISRLLAEPFMQHLAVARPRIALHLGRFILEKDGSPSVRRQLLALLERESALPGTPDIALMGLWLLLGQPLAPGHRALLLEQIAANLAPRSDPFALCLNAAAGLTTNAELDRFGATMREIVHEADTSGDEGLATLAFFLPKSIIPLYLEMGELREVWAAGNGVLPLFPYDPPVLTEAVLAAGLVSFCAIPSTLTPVQTQLLASPTPQMRVLRAYLAHCSDTPAAIPALLRDLSYPPRSLPGATDNGLSISLPPQVFSLCHIDAWDLLDRAALLVPRCPHWAFSMAYADHLLAQSRHAELKRWTEALAALPALSHANRGALAYCRLLYRIATSPAAECLDPPELGDIWDLDRLLPLHFATALLHVARLHAAQDSHSELALWLPTVLLDDGITPPWLEVVRRPARNLLRHLKGSRSPGRRLTRTSPGALTDRELEVLRHRADGLSIDDTAATLFLSADTVKRHQLNATEKLLGPSPSRRRQVSEVIAEARRRGLLP